MPKPSCHETKQKASERGSTLTLALSMHRSTEVGIDAWSGHAELNVHRQHHLSYRPFLCPNLGKTITLW